MSRPARSGSFRGALVAASVAVFLASACAASSLTPAETFLDETRSFCAEVGSYRDAYEAWEAGGEWDDWHAEASALTEALDAWEQARPADLPADVDTALDDYSRSFVERLRGRDNVQALADECDALTDSLERQVEAQG